MKNIGTNIRQKRKELGMTQEELAEKMGYKSKSSINKIELGENDIPQSKVVKFAEVLHTSIGMLMGWEQDKIDSIAEIQKDANEYSDEVEKNILSFNEEFAEAHFSPAEIFQLKMFMRSMKNNAEVKIDLGKAIKEAREAKGMTQENLAKRLEVPVEMIELYEGSMTFPYDQMKKLNSILDISFYTMLGIPMEDASLYEKIYFLHLDEDEMKEVYDYAKYIKSKRA